MERYLSAAERIAGWALATDNLPAKPLEIGYLAREQRIRRADRSTIEAEHRVEFAGEYIVRFGLPGERPAIDGVDATPVKLGFWMDGTLLATPDGRDQAVGTRVLQSVFRRRVPALLPEGDHVFRAGFIDDLFIQTLPGEDSYNRQKNKFLDSITFVGPFPSIPRRQAARRSSLRS